MLAALRLCCPSSLLRRQRWVGHGSRFSISLLSQGLCRNSGSDMSSLPPAADAPSFAAFVTLIPPPPPFFFFFFQSQASRPEQSVMQALESLTETQVRGWMPGQDGDKGGGRGGEAGREGQLRPRVASPPKSFGVGASLRFHLQRGWER